MKQMWDPTILARAAALQLQARRLVWGYRHGRHRSPQISKSIEFVGHKEYTPGDSIRDIDWRVVARSEKLLVRRHQAESEHSIIVVVDASGDMATADGRLPALDRSKFGYALTLAASFLLLLQRRGERVGLAIWGGEGWHNNWLPPRRSSVHLAELLTNLAATQPSGEARLAENLGSLSQKIPRRSMVCIFSDFMEEPAEWGPRLLALSAQGADIRVAHLHSSKEFSLELEDSARLYSFEGGDSLPIEPDNVRMAFRTIVQDYLREVNAWATKSRSLWIPTPFEEQPVHSFLRLIQGV